MRYLFVHQNFPGQYLHILRHLAAEKAHELIFLTEARTNHLEGVRKLVRPLPPTPPLETHPDAREFALHAARAAAAADSAWKLKRLGFEPDIIIGHHGWGELLNLPDVWPDAKILGYHEFFYDWNGADVNFDPEFPTPPENFSRIRVKNAINLLALNNPGRGQTPTQFQLNTYPAWARPGISLLPEGVNLDVTRPNPAIRGRSLSLGGYRFAPTDKLVTYVVRDLEPYRGFHVFMRAIPHLLRERGDVRVLLVGGDGVSYGARPERGTWRERMLDELGGAIDSERVHFAGRVPYDTYVRLLQRSDAHVYLTYPFVASWSLREALASGCAIVASDTAPVREFVRHGRTGRLVPFLDPRRIAEGVLEALEDAEASARMREAARHWAERHLAMEDYLSAYQDLIARTVSGELA